MAQLTLLEAAITSADVTAARINYEAKGGKYTKRAEQLSKLWTSMVAQIEEDTGSTWPVLMERTEETMGAMQLSPEAARIVAEISNVLSTPWKLDQNDQAP